MIIKNKIFPLIDQIFVSGGNFLTILLCAKFLTSEGQGHFIILYSIYMAILLFSVSAIYSVAPVMYGKFNRSDSYIFTIFSTHIILTLIITSILFASNIFLDLFIGHSLSNSEFIIFILFIFFQQFSDFGRRISYISAITKINGVLYSGLTFVPRIVLIYLFKPHTLLEVFILLLLTAIPSFILIIIQMLKLSIQYKATFHCDYLKEHFLFSKNLIKVFPLGWLIAYIPIYFLGYFYGSVVVGIIGTLKSITNIANLFVEMIEVSYIGYWFNIYKEHGLAALEQNILKTFWLFVFFWIFGCFAIWFGYDLIVYFLGKEYEGFKAAMLFLWLSYLLYFISRIFILYYRILSNTKLELEVAIFSLLVAMLSIIVIAQYAFNGAIASYMLIALSPLVYIYIINKRTKFAN